MRTRSLRRYETPRLNSSETIPAATLEILKRKAQRVRQIGRVSQIVTTLTVVVGAAVIVALSSATSSYFGPAAVPYLALIAVLAVYAYHQNKIEFLETQIEFQHDVLVERIIELEVAIMAPNLQSVLHNLKKGASLRDQGFRHSGRSTRRRSD
jgi:hypothetical protein